MASKEEKLAALAARRESLAAGRGAAPAALSPAEIKERNRVALEKRKAAAEASKQSENSKPLPEGWRRVESRSRPGEFVYENIHTEERQAWFPDAPAVEEVQAPMVAEGMDDAKKAALRKKNQEALARRKAEADARKKEDATRPVPPGWVRVESRSRPGEFVYENTATKERQAWFPEEAGGSKVSDEKRAKAAAALAAFKEKRGSVAGGGDDSRPLPEGWRRVESRSRPGEFVYENILTEERQAWFPEGPAEKPLPEGWRKVESRTYPGEFVYENVHTLERQAWVPESKAPLVETQEGTSPAQRTAAQLAALAKGRAAPTRQIVCQARALYDYTAVNAEEEIDLLEGDIVAVEYKADNGWWVGINRRSQKNGIFPGTYVEEIP